MIAKRIIDEFTLGYIYSALWSLDENCDIKDISPIYLQDIIDDCKSFQEENKQLLDDFYIHSKKMKLLLEQYKISPEHLGHDYWLARNRLSFDFVKRAPLELVQKFQFAANKRGEQKLIMDCETLKFLNAA